MIQNLSTQRTITLLQPQRITFGVGATEECLAYLKAQESGSILLLASGSCLKHSSTFADAITARGDAVEVRTGIPPEPSIKDLEEMLEQYADQSFDTVIGLGGGSVLDVAKLFSALHGTQIEPRSILGNGLIQGRRPLLVCLPTTAGAGSEVSPNAILFDEASNLKQAAISPWLIPDAAFIDPSFTLTLPMETTAATGVDALSHCIEAYTSKRAHPVVDQYAKEGIALISRNLVTAVTEGSNLEARSAVALGSLYGGLCLGPVNTAGVHALSYPLGSTYRIPHGLSNALLLPHVMAYNLIADPVKYAKIARLMGITCQGDDEATARRGIGHLQMIMRKCRMQTGLGSLGIQREAIPALAEAAMKVERLLVNNPRPIARADAELIYQQSF